MKKIVTLVLCLAACLGSFAQNDTYQIKTKNTTILLRGKSGEKLNFVYYGISPSNLSEIYDSGNTLWEDAYPTLGNRATNTHALQVKHADGNMSLELVIDKVETKELAPGVTLTKFSLKDKLYPFFVDLFYKAYTENDVIETWAEFSHNEKNPVLLQKYASAFMPVRPGGHYLTHLHGTWGNEHMQTEEPLARGVKMIRNSDGVRNTMSDNPAFMISLDSRPSETNGDVIAGALAWTGNYSLEFSQGPDNRTEILAGINPEASEYTLAKGVKFTTPEMIFTYSTTGKGGASRNLHSWARKHKLVHGMKERDILLNSWEGVYMKVNQEVMDEMMRDFSSIGGELFVMDDGWFGEKYPRDRDNSSLGDWTVAKGKLPKGIEALVASANAKNIKFGIWIEPEMTNVKSELYEKHPDWVLTQPNREPTTGRGGNQLVLDMTNPKVQDFVFGVVDDLLTRYPQIAYIKWDANMSLMNYGSQYLPKDRQSHVYVDYHKGLRSTLERIRAKYPDVVLQACASGGGRVNYGFMPYFDECWTSDNTDALHRIYMQWGMLNFYPSITMASHVSASPNHQTGRVTPIKFRFDVAMTGRLGMEMLPSAMTEAERKFAATAIADYKRIRPVIQHGDLYKIMSPYDTDFASLIYVAPSKEKAVFFTYRTGQYLRSEVIPRFVLQGLDASKSYRVREINAQNAERPWYGKEGKVFSGAFLMSQGLTLPLDQALASIVFELTEVK